MRMLFVTTALIAFVSAAPRAVETQDAKAPAAARTNTIVVTVDAAKPLTLTPADIRALPRTTVKMEEDGRTIVYEGVLVGELLKRAGAASGPDMRGNAMTSYVVASANDGYQVVFSLAELDPGFTSNDIIVADTVDGKPLFEYQGPFRIVAPKDKRGARSIRMLERLEVVRLRK